STAWRISLTPDSTAEMVTKCASARVASRRARVVLPTPGGPQKIIECSAPCSSAVRSGRPGPSRCCCPAYSSSVAGRMRAASGYMGWVRGANRSMSLSDDINSVGNLKTELRIIQRRVQLHIVEQDIGALPHRVAHLHIVDQPVIEGHAQTVEHGIGFPGGEGEVHHAAAVGEFDIETLLQLA